MRSFFVVVVTKILLIQAGSSNQYSGREKHYWKKSRNFFEIPTIIWLWEGLGQDEMAGWHH